MTEIALEKLVARNVQDTSKLYRLSTLLRRRSPQERWEYEEGAPLLRRVLTWLDVLSCGICMTVGAGIFVIAGSVAHETAGPAVVLSFLLSGVSAMISSFCYSEFSARVPVSGSTYSFTYVALGEFIGWMAGWITIIEYTLGPAVIAKGLAQTCMKVALMFSMDFPEALLREKIDSLSVFPMAAVFIIILTALVLVGGIKGSALFCRVMSVCNIAAIVFISIAGIHYIQPTNWSNFAPFGLTGILKGASRVFFAYTGFENSTTLATEVKNPKKNMPRGVIGTLLITIFLYLASCLVITGMVNYQDVTSMTPFIDAFEDHDAHWAATIVAIGSLLCMSTTILSSLLGLPRILFQMSKDGLLGIAFSELNRFKVPYKSTVVIGVLTSLLTFFMDLDFLNDMLCCGVLVTYTMMNLSVISLRFSDSDSKMERKHVLILVATALSCIPVGVGVSANLAYYILPVCLLPFAGCIFLVYQRMPTTLLAHPPLVDSFTCPWVPFLPCLGMLFNIVMIVQLGISPLVQVLVWACVGSCVYFIFGIKNSKLNFIDSADQFYY